MKINLDENKYTPELVFDNAGLKVYKYNKPFFIYCRGERVVDMTATRCLKLDGERLYKTPCIYQLWFSKQLQDKINEKAIAKVTTEPWNIKIIESSWDRLRINTNYLDEIISSTEEITGYKFNGIFDGLFWNMQSVNKKNDTLWYKDTRFFTQKSDWVELTNTTAKERRHEEEVNKQIRHNILDYSLDYLLFWLFELF